jgi:hypothetical protein
MLLGEYCELEINITKAMHEEVIRRVYIKYGARFFDGNLHSEFTLEGAVGSHACLFEASMCVTDGIPIQLGVHSSYRLIL